MQNQRESKKQNLEYSKELAGIAQAQRAEGIEDVKGGYDIYGKQLTRDIQLAQANKPNAAREYAYNHRDVMKAKGDPRSEKELINEGLLIHLREATKYDPAMRGIDIRGGQLGVDREEQLRKQREDEAKTDKQLYDNARMALGGHKDSSDKARRKFEKDYPTPESKLNAINTLVNKYKKLGTPGATAEDLSTTQPKPKVNSNAASKLQPGFVILPTPQ
jgi:hypothetical protein